MFPLLSLLIPKEPYVQSCFTISPLTRFLTASKALCLASRLEMFLSFLEAVDSPVNNLEPVVPIRPNNVEPASP